MDAHLTGFANILTINQKHEHQCRPLRFTGAKCLFASAKALDTDALTSTAQVTAGGEVVDFIQQYKFFQLLKQHFVGVKRYH